MKQVKHVFNRKLDYPETLHSTFAKTKYLYSPNDNKKQLTLKLKNFKKKNVRNGIIGSYNKVA